MLATEDPTSTEEIRSIELTCRTIGLGGITPPAFFWYRHCGYRENWNRREWNEPTMQRSFDAYMQEAIERGWWDNVALPPADVPPRVLLQAGGNTLRRVRGGQNMLLRHLWPQARMVVTMDWRMCTTALHSDIVLPVTNAYESPRFHIPTPHMLSLIYSDRAVEAAGEAKSEWEISRLLAEKLTQRAQARGMGEYTNRRGVTCDLRHLAHRFTLQGALITDEDACEEMLRDTVIVGTIHNTVISNAFRKSMPSTGGSGFMAAIASSHLTYLTSAATAWKPDLRLVIVSNYCRVNIPKLIDLRSADETNIDEASLQEH
jgi:hypothetical protein